MLSPLRHIAAIVVLALSIAPLGQAEAGSSTEYRLLHCGSQGFEAKHVIVGTAQISVSNGAVTVQAQEFRPDLLDSCRQAKATTPEMVCLISTPIEVIGIGLACETVLVDSVAKAVTMVGRLSEKTLLGE